MFFTQKRKVSTGLDLDKNSFKYAAVDPANTVILDLFKADIMTDRQSKDDELKGENMRSRLLDIIEECKKACHSFDKRVKIAVQGKDTVFHYMEFPDLSSKELTLATQSMAVKYIPFPMDEVNFSYISVPQISSGDKKSAIFFVAAKKSFIDDKIALLEECGLIPARIEIPAMALVREFYKNHAFGNDRFLALINVGFNLTTVILMRGGYPYYVREFPVAGSDFIYAVQMGMQLSWKDSVAYAANHDFKNADPQIQPFLDRWINEIKKTFDFFVNQFSESGIKIDKIFISGAAAELKNLDKSFSKHINMDVAVDTWDLLKYNGSESGACNFKIAVGLGLED